jgi:Rrf2 family protein
MNTRFAVAIHVLSFLSFAKDRLVTSEELASSVNTHAALVRRMLSILREGGLIETQLGPGGGARLARGPDSISLLDVYDAIRVDDDLFAVGRLSPNHDCPMGSRIQNTLEQVLAAPEAALRLALSRISVAEVQRTAMAGVPEASAQTLAKQPPLRA